jgi:hypothetical protein
MKVYWGSAGIAPGRFTIKEKSPWYILDRRLGGPQSRPGHGGEEKNFQVLLELDLPIIQPVAQGYATELSRLLSNIITK